MKEEKHGGLNQTIIDIHRQANQVSDRTDSN